MSHGKHDRKAAHKKYENHGTEAIRNASGIQDKVAAAINASCDSAEELIAEVEAGTATIDDVKAAVSNLRSNASRIGQEVNS